MSDASPGPRCVILDTNVWDAHTMLRTHLAASLIYLLDQHGATLGVPEVVEIEVRKHLHATLQKEVRSATGALDRIRMVLGEGPDPDLPTTAVVDAALEERLGELASLLVRVPLEDRHYVSAGRMVLSGMAPNAPKSQQFKDCLLWQAVLDLSAGRLVLLVTSDGGFYAEKDGSDLHHDLAPMADRVQVVRSLEGAVALLQETVPALDLDPIFVAVDHQLLPQVAALAILAGSRWRE